MRYRRVFQPGASYLFTFVTHGRAPIFSAPGTVALYMSAIHRVQSKRPFTIEAHVILPDHIHVLWTLPADDADYPTRIRLIKSAFAKSMAESLTSDAPSKSRIRKRERAIWQRRYWEHTIRDEKDFQAHLDYIHLNPVKHGLAAAPGDWPYSTFREWVARGAYEPWWGSAEMPPLPHWDGHE
jgi:putative transposase